MYNYSSYQNQISYDEIYQQAERRVAIKMSFYTNLASYIIINLMLAMIYLMTSLANGHFGHPWFLWVLFAWGGGIILQAIHLQHVPMVSQQQMIREEMQRVREEFTA